MSEPRSPDEIREDIESTREELADTAAALAQKADVKGRAQDRVEEIKSDVKEKVSDAAPSSVGDAAESVKGTVQRNPIPTGVIAAALLGFALGYLIARRGRE